MNIKELKEDNRYLKEENKLLYNKLARILRYVDACSIVGKTDVPIKDIKEMISSKEMI